MTKIRPDMAIGQTIRGIRKSLGMTQDFVVTKMQLMGIPITRSNYAKIETNRLNIKVSELLALTFIFHVTPDDIFRDCLNEMRQTL